MQAGMRPDQDYNTYDVGNRYSF